MLTSEIKNLDWITSNGLCFPGKLKTGNESYKGEIEIPNLSEEHLPEDVDINVTLKDGSTGSSAYEVKEFVRSEGIKEIRRQLTTYIRELREG